jgi:ABC-2 type transport system permease protein
MKDSLSKSLIISLFLVVFISWGISLVLVNMDWSQSSNKVNVGLVNLDRSNLSYEVDNILDCDANIIYPVSSDYEEIEIPDSDFVELRLPEKSIEEYIEATKNNGGDALIVIEKGFGDSIVNNSLGCISVYYIVETYGVGDLITSEKILLLLEDLKLQMIYVLMPNNSPINSTIIMNSFEINETTIVKGEVFENTTATDATGFVTILQVFVPFMVLVFIMFMGASIIESIAKERRCDMLETLLSFPVKRRDIIIGKILSCIVSMFVIMLILQGGGSIAMISVISSASDTAVIQSSGVTLSSIDYVFLMIIMLSGMLCGIALLTCSAMLTSTNTRSFFASLPSMMLFSIPTVILVIYDFSSLSLMSKLILVIIPGSHPSIAINSVINGNYVLAVGSITYLVLFSFLVFGIVLKLFKSDRVVA